MRIAILQMTSGIDPAENARFLTEGIAQAKARGAQILFTPEMSGAIDRDTRRSSENVTVESGDTVLQAVCTAAAEQGIWVQLGSLAIRQESGGKRHNRAYLIDNQGRICARYDKMHLFDVQLANGESWQESAIYRAGDGPTLAPTPWGPLGLTICYDLRFPALFQALAEGGATFISVPAAFTVPTGQAHWHLLLRARAIENACFIIAAAQTGLHADGRETYGHSLVVDPWGDVLLDAGTQPGLYLCDIEPEHVTKVLQRVPVRQHRRAITPVTL
jgi:deaminated glutathione amidase